jgi:hypothetical protein
VPRPAPYRHRAGPWPRCRFPLLLWRRLASGQSGWVNPKGCQTVAGGRRGLGGGDLRVTARKMSCTPEGCQTRSCGVCAIRSGSTMGRLGLAPLRGARSSDAVSRWSFPLSPERPPYSFSGLIHRLGWDPSTSSPAQPVNKSARATSAFDNLGPAPVRISTTARSTSCSRSPRPEPVTRTRIRILRCRHSTSCTIRTAPRAHIQTIRE